MIVNSNQFSYNKEKNSFVTEMSSLCRLAEEVNIFNQIYPDAADQGFTMISERTGTEAKFVVKLYEHDSEGEFVAWHLVPTAETVRKNPRLRCSTVIIFND